MKKMMKMVKGALALALVALVGTAEAGQAITLTAKSDSKTYDGTPLNAAGYTLSGSLKSREIGNTKWTKKTYNDYIESVTYSPSSATDAGVHAYKVSGVVIKGNKSVSTAWEDWQDVTSEYDVTYADGGKLTITPATVTSMTLNGPTVLPYTGNPQTVTVKEVKAGNLTLSSSDYDVSGNTATQPGQYTVTVTGKGNYQGTATADWEIKSHEHNWSYATSTDGNVVTLTATCTNPDCTLNPPTTSATLTLSSGDKAYDGQAITATLDKGDFEATTGITLGDVQCTGNATDVGTYKFSVSATGTGCDFSKTVEISQRDISNATFELDNSSFDYTDEMRTVNVKTFTAGGVTVNDYDKSGVWSAQYVGTYEVTVTGKGNFCGSKSTTWTIKTPTKAITGASAADPDKGYGTVTDNKLTVSDTTKLVWRGDNTWSAGITLTWPIDERHNSTWDFTQGWDYTDVAHARMQLSTTDKVYTGTQIQAGETDGEDLTLATDTKKYKKVRLGSELSCTYVKTTTWKAKFTLKQVTDAIAASETHLTYQMTAFAPLWTGDDYLGNKYGVAPATYTIEVPLAGIVLNDGDGNQVYPALPYVAQVAETKLKYLTLGAALSAATAGQTVNALAACEAGAFSVGANVTLNLGGYGADGATYAFVDVTDLNMGAKVVSTKAETVSTSVAGFDVQKAAESFTYTLYRSHFHLWEFALNGATLTANCTNTTTECDLPGRATSIELTVTGGSDGVAPTFAIANQEAFLASVNKFGTIVTSIGSIATVRLTDDGAALNKWYVGDYRSTCDVMIAGEGTLTLTNDFKISKPSGGYAKTGWIAGSRDVRYDSWEESLAAASDGDTVYYKGDDRNFKTHEFSIGAKNLTLDFGGKTLKYTNGTEDMTLKNAGTGTLTFQNVTIQQPKYAYISHQISAVGNIQFGTGVRTTNQADNKDRYLKITASEGTLTVTNGQYECSFAGSYKLRGGQYKSTYGEPTADTANGYIVRTISGDYDRDIVYHEHHIVYSAQGNVISATCDAQDHEFCGFGTKTATLNAPNKQEDGQPYSLAEIVYSDGFPEQTGVITYWNGDEEISAPTTFGSYTAKTTIGGATAVKAFEIIHKHNFVYDADQANGTITARCTTTADCDFNVNKRIATLTAQNGTYTGFGQDLAATATNTSDFPTNVALTYSCEGKPTTVGDYTATMTVADTVTVTKDFSIAKASMGDVAASMTAATLNFTGAEQQNTLGSATLGSYNLQSGDYELSGVTAATGSGYSNETYQVTLTAKGDNFSGSKTIEWTIKAPATEFANDALGRFDYEDYGGNYGEAGARSLTVTDSTKLIFVNGTWFAGLTVQPPMTDGWSFSDSFWVSLESLRTSLSTLPGKTYTGTDVSTNAAAPWLTLTTKEWGLISSYKRTYVDHVRGLFNITPKAIEEAAANKQENVTFTMTAGGIAWSPNSGENNWDGVKYTDFTLVMPVANAVFAVRASETADIGDTVLAAAKIRLDVGATVTTTVQQTEGQIYTDVTGYQVYETEDAGTYTYSCVAKPQVTVEDAAHQATKVVKVGDTEITGEGNVYTVDYNSTVTATYTFETGYESAESTKTAENVTGNTTITAPTVTAKSYAITYELDGGENDPANPATYTIESETITLADPTKADYTFTGWTPEGVIAKGSTGDKSFTATWKLATVEFTPLAPENASVTKVATNGVELASPYKVMPGTTVTVTYKANEGYLFADGKNTMDAEITVSQGGDQPAPQGTETTKGAAKIGTTYYLTLADAVEAYDGTADVVLCGDATGAAIGFYKSPKAGQMGVKDLVIDFGGYTYTVDGPLAGSSGTETQAFHFEGGTIVLTNGTITSSTAKMLIQNYTDLTIADLVVDGSDLMASNSQYVFSNNQGDVNLTGASAVIAPDGEGWFAMDSCKYGTYTAPVVTLADTVVVTGKVELSGGTLVPNGAEVDVSYAGKFAYINYVPYTTLKAAFGAVESSQTIEVAGDLSGDGIFVAPNKIKNVTVKFNGHTYTVTGNPVGSSTTETQGFHIEKDNSLNFIGGTITSVKGSGVKMLVQNYANLLLVGTVLDGANLDGTGKAYTLSTNNGKTTLAGATVKARGEGDFAFDVCCFSPYTANEVVMLVSNETVNVQGDIEISSYNGVSPKFHIYSGTIDGKLVMAEGADKAEIMKAAGVTLAEPEGYQWNYDASTGWSTLVKKSDTPYVPEEEGTVIVDEENKTVTVIPEEGTNVVEVINSGDYKVEVPTTIDMVKGVDSTNIVVVALATNGTETVKVDITDAFVIENSVGGGATIELNDDPTAEVTVEIEGKEPETIKVTPELTETTDDVKPLVIDETKVATGVKTIPGLKYSLLSGDTVDKIETVVKTIVAEDTRVVLEAAKELSKTAKFYKIKVEK